MGEDTPRSTSPQPPLVLDVSDDFGLDSQGYLELDPQPTEVGSEGVRFLTSSHAKRYDSSVSIPASSL